MGVCPPRSDAQMLAHVIDEYAQLGRGIPAGWPQHPEGYGAVEIIIQYRLQQTLIQRIAKQEGREEGDTASLQHGIRQRLDGVDGDGFRQHQLGIGFFAAQRPALQLAGGGKAMLQAGMPGQFAWMRRCSVLFEIAGRGHQHMRTSTQPARHQARIGLLAGADHDVKALFHHVHHAVRHVDIKIGISRLTSCGAPTRKRPRGLPAASDNSASAASTSLRMRRQRSRNSAPSDVSVILRVLRWNNRTRSRSSMRAMLLPTADDDTPRIRPASVKLRVSATCTNIEIPLRLSMVIRFQGDLRVLLWDAPIGNQAADSRTIVRYVEKSGLFFLSLMTPILLTSHLHFALRFAHLPTNLSNPTASKPCPNSQNSIPPSTSAPTKSPTAWCWRR